MQTVWLMDKLLKYPFLDRVPDSSLWLTDFLRKNKNVVSLPWIFWSISRELYILSECSLVWHNHLYISKIHYWYHYHAVSGLWFVDILQLYLFWSQMDFPDHKSNDCPLRVGWFQIHFQFEYHYRRNGSNKDRIILHYQPIAYRNQNLCRSLKDWGQSYNGAG